MRPTFVKEHDRRWEVIVVAQDELNSRLYPSATIFEPNAQSRELRTLDLPTSTDVELPILVESLSCSKLLPSDTLLEQRI